MRYFVKKNTRPDSDTEHASYLRQFGRRTRELEEEDIFDEFLEEEEKLELQAIARELGN